MPKAIVRTSDLSILGHVEDSVTTTLPEGDQYVEMSDALIGQDIIARPGSNGSIQVVLNPSSAPLESKKKAAQIRLDQDLHVYVDARYTPLQRDAIMRQIDIAEKNNLPNKLAYCQQFENWINGEVLVYYVTKDAEIAACETEAELQAIEWSFDTLTATDPDVKISVAYATND